MKDELTASEALFGFAGWITTRSQSITAGAGYDAAGWAALVAEFCETNKLKKPRKSWPKHLTHPKETRHQLVTGD